MLKGKRVVIEKLSLPDAYQMMNWRKAEGILKREYHFLTTRDGNVKEWYDARVSRKDIVSYTVKNCEGKVIGFISIRDISRIFKSAVLGITFDMNYLGQGFGTESLRLFLDYYFQILGMKKIVLDVAKHNERAINCYKSIGFKVTNKYFAKLEEECYDEIIEQMKDKRDDFLGENFRIIGPFIFIAYYKMKLKRKEYLSFSRRGNQQNPNYS